MNISTTSLIILAVTVKHPIYTEESNISFEKYEPNNDSSCSINCCSRSINDCNWTATTGISMAAVPKGSWLTAPYGDSPDALFFCGAGLRQFTGTGAYGCGNGPEGGQVLPWG